MTNTLPTTANVVQDIIFLTGDHTHSDVHQYSVAGQEPSTSQQIKDSSNPNPAASAENPFPAAQALTETQYRHGGGNLLLDGTLAMLSSTLDDTEEYRIAMENRLRTMTRAESDSDGEVRGMGLTDSHPAVVMMRSTVEQAKQMEHDQILNLQRQIRKSPLHAWIKRNKGIGEKQASRLISVIGDPFWNALHDRPRTVSELWSYCGYGVADGAARRRKKGEQANWSDTAKSRAFLMSASCVKALGGNYRGVYDNARAKYAGAVHEVACVRCGPAGKPAQPGSLISDGHAHARALRIVSKTILKDLWSEAREHYIRVGAIERPTNEPVTWP